MGLFDGSCNSKTQKGQIARSLEIHSWYDMKNDHGPRRHHRNEDLCKPFGLRDDAEQEILVIAAVSHTTPDVACEMLTEIKMSQKQDTALAK